MKRRKEQKQESQSRLRAELVMKVLCRQMTATEAARQLGVSRKTYYKWEKRGVSGMLNALTDRDSGRPSVPVDGEKEEIRRMVTRMQKALLKSEQRHSIRTYLDEEIKAMDAVEKIGVKKKE